MNLKYNFKYNLITTKNTKLQKTDEYFKNTTLVYGLTLESGYIRYISDNKELIKPTCVHFRDCLAWCNSRVGFFQTRDNVRNSRLRKTELFFSNRKLFLNLLQADLNNMIIEAKNKGLEPYFRLNVASDLAIDIFEDLINKFPEIKFYDYTKSLSKIKNLKIYHSHGRLLNYKIAYSVSNFELLDDNFVDTIDTNLVSILPVLSKESYELPKFFIKNNEKIAIIEGDNHDLRVWKDPKKSIVLLKFKGSRDTLNKLINENNPYILSQDILWNRFIF